VEIRLADVRRRVVSGILLFIFLLAGLAAAPLASASGAPLDVTGYKMAGDAVHTRVVMNFDRAQPEPPHHRWRFDSGFSCDQ